MTEPALVVEGARRRFTGGNDGDVVDALDGVDLCVVAGSITAVLGPSGCGKTTLLRAIAGTERLDAGRIRIDGAVVVDAPVAGAPVAGADHGGGRRSIRVPPERRRVGLVPQEGALFPHLDVAGNIAFGIRSLGRAARRDRVEELLDLVELSGCATRRTHELSGGERQRVALARALAPRPDVVLLDEPFSALDATLRAALRDEVASLLRRSATTALLVTHDRTEAMAMADEVAVMRAGRIVQVGRPDELYRRPIDAWTARFLGDVVVLPGRIVGDAVDCALGLLPLGDGIGADCGADGSEVTVLLRPEQIVRRGDGATVGIVVAVRFLGPDVVVEIRIVGPTHTGCVVCCRWSSSEGEPVIGEQVSLAVVGPVRVLERTSEG
ncbi:MAG: ABC transporter ATP-binding protein [Actinobacteria bacterium]|nr:ABC transporter ATP-binding protein [Actinomycetota bacterium]